MVIIFQKSLTGCWHNSCERNGMNIGLLTSALVNGIGADIGPSGTAAGKNPKCLISTPFCNTSQNGNPSRVSSDDQSSSNTSAGITTDNIPFGIENKPINNAAQKFQQTLVKKTMTEGPQEGQDDTDSKAQSLTVAVAGQPNVVQNWLALFPLLEHGQKGLAGGIGPKAGYELAQLLAALKAGQFVPTTSQAVITADNKLSLATDGSSQGNKAILFGVFDSSILARKKGFVGKNGGQMPIPAVATAKALAEQKNGKESTLSGEGNIATVISKIAAVSSKPIIQNTPVASKGQSINAAGGKESMPEEFAGEGKPVVFGTQKTYGILNNNGLPAAQGKPAGLQQDIPVGLEKDAPVAEKPAPNEADAGQQGGTAISRSAAKRGSVEMLSELLGSKTQEQSGNPLSDSVFHKLNVTGVQISTGQTKDSNSSLPDNSSYSNGKGLEQMLSSIGTHSPQSSIEGQSSAFAMSAKTAGAASFGGVSANISEQIYRTVSGSLGQGEQQITIQLNPPELGRVFIKFQEQADQITGLLEVSKIQTKVEIQQALPEIIRNLADCGIVVKRLEVVLSETGSSEQQPYKEPSLQDGWFQQGGSANSGASGNSQDTFGTDEWLANDNNYQDITGLEEMLITDKSINILI